MKSIVIALTALLAVSSVLISCGSAGSGETVTEQNPTKEENTEAQKTTEAETAVETEAFKDALGYLPDMDMEGWTMNVIGHEDSRSGFSTFYTEGLDGEVLNDAIFNRNQRIQDRYNMNFNMIPSPTAKSQWAGVAIDLKKSIVAGDDAYDMAIFYDYAMQGRLVSEKMFFNMLNVPYIDYSNPWWHTDFNKTYEHYGYLPCVLSDYSVNSYQYANMIIYNQVMQQNFDLPDFYDMVRNHKWTLDSFKEIVKTVSSDTNGDGKMDTADTYGFSTNFGYHALTWAYAIGEMGVTLTDSGVQLGFTSEKFTNMTQWLYDLFTESKTTLEMGWDEPCTIDWDENRVLFEAIWLIDLEKFRNCKSPYGMLPYPAYDENQDRYYTYDDCRCAAFGIPLTSTPTDIGRTGLILEALSADSYYNVIPQYLGSVVDAKLALDEESLEMLDYIMSGRVRDIGYAMPDSRQYGWILKTDLIGKSGVLTSTLEANSKAALKYYDSILEKWKDLSEMDWSLE